MKLTSYLSNLYQIRYDIVEIFFVFSGINNMVESK